MNGYISFHLACYYGYLETVKSLIKRGLINKIIMEILLKKWYFAIIKLLIKNTCLDINVWNKNGHFEIIKLLLKDTYLKINIKNEVGITGFHYARVNWNLAIVKFLLKDDNLEINIQNEDGITSFHSACSFGDFTIVEILMQDIHLEFNSKDKFVQDSYMFSSVYTPMRTI